jgi:hypothetical protein
MDRAEAEALRASVRHTSGRIAIPPICSGHIDRRHLRGCDACFSFPKNFAS